jgi:nucleoid-associated protein YgaU
VLAACGLALATGASPALADSHGHHHHGAALLVGLPLPDRAALPARGQPHRPRVVEVDPGDTLWSIAARDLAADASAAVIGARWRAIYAANRVVIGPDPDVIEPGQRLRLPRTHPRSLPGKDSS